MLDGLHLSNLAFPSCEKLRSPTHNSEVGNLKDDNQDTYIYIYIPICREGDSETDSEREREIDR